LLDCYRVSRRLLSESPFLDQRMTARSAGKEQVAFSYNELTSLAADMPIDNIGFIFHTSFCRSTLMSQALHVDGISFSLKEPSILLSLAESVRYTRAMHDPDKIRVALPAMLKLATGLANAGERTIIKPTNFANNLLPYVAETGAKVLLMYSDLRNYLISILKYGERGRAFTRQLYTRLMVDYDEFRNMDPRRALLQTDLQIAALVWKQQMSLFMKVLSGSPQSQIRTLDSSVFATHRDTVLAEVFRFFEISVTSDQIDRILFGPVFQQHSKSGKSVDDQLIQRQTLEVAEKYHEELESTLRWAESISIGKPVSTPLPNGLVVPGITGS